MPAVAWPGSVLRRFNRATLVATLTLVGHFPPAHAQEVTRLGTLVELWGDPPAGSPTPPTLDHFLVDDQARWLALDLNPFQLRSSAGASMAGRRVMVSGILEPRRGSLFTTGQSEPLPRLRVTAIQPAEPEPQSWRRGAGMDSHRVLRYVTVLCRFPGSADEGPRTPSEYRLWMGPESPGMGHYWHSLSRGLMDFLGETVVGWYELPRPIEHYFEDPEAGRRNNPDWGLLAQDCAALADEDVDFSPVDGVNLQFNVEFGAAWGGSSILTLDGQQRLFGVTWMPTWASHSTYGHEIGHTLGLPHSSGPYETAYDSEWDVMSHGNTLWSQELQTHIGQHTIAYHRDLLGWVSPGRKWVGGSFGETETVALEFWNQIGGSGWDMVEVPLGDGTFYTAEARRQVGYDEGIPFRSVVIHHVNPWIRDRQAQVVDIDANGNPNDAAAAWVPGETFSDPDRGVEITVLQELTGTPGWDEGFLLALTRGWRLELKIMGDGSVGSPSHDLQWTADSSHLFPDRASLTLEAQAEEGSVFAGWSGSCSGLGDCSVTLSGRDTVRADFTEPFSILSERERPPAMVGAWYADQLEARGGSTDRTWRISEGALPKGLVLDSVAGTVGGIPEVDGRFSFLVTAASKALRDTAELEMSVGTPALTLRQVVDELLRRGSTLGLEDTRFLDITGNQNGRFDIGDVLLYMRGSEG